MHALSPDRARDDLHRASGIIAPATDLDARQTRVPSGKKPRMPAKQTLTRERGVAITRRIEHHIHDTFDMTINRSQSTDVDTQAARNG